MSCLDLKGRSDLANVMKKRQGAKAFDFLGRKNPFSGAFCSLAKSGLI